MELLSTRLSYTNSPRQLGRNPRHTQRAPDLAYNRMAGTGIPRTQDCRQTHTHTCNVCLTSFRPKHSKKSIRSPPLQKLATPQRHFSPSHTNKIITVKPQTTICPRPHFWRYLASPLTHLCILGAVRSRRSVDHEVPRVDVIIRGTRRVRGEALRRHGRAGVAVRQGHRRGGRGGGSGSGGADTRRIRGGLAAPLGCAL